MGLDLVYKCGNLDLPTRFSMADWRTIDQLRSHLPDAIATLVDVPALGEEATVPLGALRDAAERVDDLLRDRPELLPHTYQFRCENFVVAGQPIESTFSTGGFSGFHLPGDDENWYGIKARLDECRLDKMARQPDGTVRVVEQRDLRDERELETSDCGPIKIRKRRAKSSLRSGLAEIREYLKSLPEGAEITKVVG
jgi:hypothetical protein